MASIKRDDVKQKWEETEFPLVCETCLGDNPYVRMTKEPHGKPCKICETPFTVFAWQAGTRGRLKKVEICKTCAQTKNVCQVCVYDLQYGLPVQLRDKILAEEGSAGAVAAVPQSDANRAWYAAQRERAIEQGKAGAVPGTAAAIRLQSIARMEPRYDRNLPKLCSFYGRGECNRGSKCPFRHEAPRDRNDPLSKQNTKDRFYGTNDPVAERMVARQREREEKRREEAKARGVEGDERSRATCYVRFVDSVGKGGGDGDAAPAPPAPARKVTEMDYRDAFYSFGEIVSVRLHSDKGAFIEYTTPEATELAVRSMNRKDVAGRKVYVNWAREAKRGNEGMVAAQRQQQQQMQGPRSGGVGGEVRPAAPPGGTGGGGGQLPKGFAPARNLSSVPRPGAGSSSLSGVPRPPNRVVSSVPRPGGGVIRGAGASSRGAAPKPYYPSADPGRLGSRTQSAATSER